MRRRYTSGAKALLRGLWSMRAKARTYLKTKRAVRIEWLP
jgi:hypothetical protein